jgi:hypothetical protein
VYMTVERQSQGAPGTTTLFIERMFPRKDNNPRLTNNNYLDCAVHFSGQNTTRSSRCRVSTASTAHYPVGTTVSLVFSTGHGLSAGDVSAGCEIVLHPADAEHAIRISISATATSTDATGTVLTNPIDANWPENPLGLDGWYATSFPTLPAWAPIDGDISGTTLSLEMSDWGAARKSFSDARLASYLHDYAPHTHLAVKADGALLASDQYTFANPLLLTTPAVFVTGGIRYTQTVESLDVPAQPTSNGNIEIHLQNKMIRKAAFQIARTAVGFQVGEAPDGPLTTWAPNDGQTSTAEFGPGSYDGTFSGLAYVPIYSGWNREGRICLVNTGPTSVTICSIIREVELGGT